MEALSEKSAGNTDDAEGDNESLGDEADATVSDECMPSYLQSSDEDVGGVTDPVGNVSPFEDEPVAPYAGACEEETILGGAAASSTSCEPSSSSSSSSSSDIGYEDAPLVPLALAPPEDFVDDARGRDRERGRAEVECHAGMQTLRY